MRSLYALDLSLSVVIPAIQPRLRLSGTNRLRSAFHGGQRAMKEKDFAFKQHKVRATPVFGFCNYSAHSAMADQIRPHASS
ncbi:MAG: hypothetical protein KZQ60_07040 [Candidatus Thiodiazotropha sp. (ex Lucinoma aequizonata)]|nr:hypothetical protein [Candidatus Thiodiazotropha sp. (ex Lucinoma aequizonata)]